MGIRSQDPDIPREEQLLMQAKELPPPTHKLEILPQVAEAGACSIHSVSCGVPGEEGSVAARLGESAIN